LTVRQKPLSPFSQLGQKPADVEWQADPIADLHAINCRADFNDDTEVFMAEDAA